MSDDDDNTCPPLPHHIAPPRPPGLPAVIDLLSDDEDPPSPPSPHRAVHVPPPVPPEPPPTVGKRIVTPSPTPACPSKRPRLDATGAIKQEPVGFGCADVGDEVVEVVNPKLSMLEASQAAAITDTDDADAVEFVGGNMVVAADMPHPREACTRHPFHRPSAMSTFHFTATNRLHCDQCYCYVCEVRAKECPSWAHHCDASHKDSMWKSLRSSLRSPLLVLLPPDRRAAIVGTVQRISFLPGEGVAEYLDRLREALCLPALTGRAEMQRDVRRGLAVREAAQPYAFLTCVIDVVHLLKKSIGKAISKQVLQTLLSAMLLTDCFTAVYSPVAMRMAILEELRPSGPYMQVVYPETLKTAVLLCTADSTSRADWVHTARPHHPQDVPRAVSGVSMEVADLVCTSLEEVGACPAALLEFSSRQGEHYVQKVFMRIVEGLDMVAAQDAMRKMSLQKSETVSQLLERIRSASSKWVEPICSASTALRRLCMMEVLFLERTHATISSADTGKVLLCIASVQMAILNRALTESDRDVYLATHGCAKPSCAGAGVDVMTTVDVLSNLCYHPSQLSPHVWQEKDNGSSNTVSRLGHFIDLTFILLLRFPTFTSKTLLAVAQSSDVESARHRLCQMKKCIDSIFCSCDRPGIRSNSFAHQVFTQFLIAHANLMLRQLPAPLNEDCRDGVMLVVNILAAHVAGNFLKASREECHDGAMRFLRCLPVGVFTVLTRHPPLSTAVSLFPPISTSDATVKADLRKWIANMPCAALTACLDDSEDSLLIAQMLARAVYKNKVAPSVRSKGSDDDDLHAAVLPCKILYARFVRVSVNFLTIFQDLQQLQKVRAGKILKKGERSCYLMWLDVVKTLGAIRRSFRTTFLPPHSDIENYDELSMAAQMACKLHIPSSWEELQPDPVVFGTELFHGAVRELKLLIIQGGRMWGFWQRLFCSIAAAGDLLTMIIWENWSHLTNLSGVVPHASMTALAKDFDDSTDIDSSSQEKCAWLWRLIMNYYDNAPNSSLAFLELCCVRRRLLDAIVVHCPIGFVRVLVNTLSPTLFRYFREGSNRPGASDGLMEVWKQAKDKGVHAIGALLQSYLDSPTLSLDRWIDLNMERALLVTIILRNQFLMVRFLNAGMPATATLELSDTDKTRAAVLIVAMLQVADCTEDLTFVLVNVMSWLRLVIREVQDYLVRKLSPSFLKELQERLMIVLRNADGATPHARPLAEALVLFKPSIESVALCYQITALGAAGESVADLSRSVQQLQVAGMVSDTSYMEICYEYFGMEPLQTFLVQQVAKDVDLVAHGMFMTGVAHLIRAAASLSADSSPQPAPLCGCSNAAKLNMSHFALRWLTAVLLKQRIETDGSSKVTEMRPFLRELVTYFDKVTLPFAETPSNNSVLVVSGDSARELMPWLLPPAVAFAVISFIAHPSKAAYDKLPPFLSAAVKNKLLSTAVDVQNMPLVIELCMRERCYSKLFLTLTSLTEQGKDAALCEWVEVLSKSFSTEHCLLPGSVAAGQLLPSESASLAVCLSGGFLASAVPWLVNVFAMCSDDVSSDSGLLQQLEALLRVVYESDAGDCAQSLCTCAAAFRANNVASLVGAIHHAMESTMAKLSQADREQLVASPDWAPFGVVGVMLNKVATAPWSAKEKVSKFVELYMLVIKAPQCICGKPSCGCSAVLANITLVKRADDMLRQYFSDMLSTKERLDAADGPDLMMCMRPLVTYVSLNPSWAANSLISNTMACLYQPGYVRMVTMFDDRGPARYFECNSWAMLIKLLVGKKIAQVVHLLYTCELASWAPTASLPDAASLFSKNDFKDAVICASNLGDLVPWTSVVCELLPLNTAAGVCRVLGFLFSFTAADLGGVNRDNPVSVTWNAILSKASLVSTFTLNLLSEVIQPLPVDTAVALLTMHPVLTDMLSQRFSAERLLYDHQRLLPLWATLLKVSPAQSTDMVKKVGYYLVTNRATAAVRTAFENFVGALKQLYRSEGLRDKWVSVSAMLCQAVASKKKLQEIVQRCRMQDTG